jgi:hypothetical protein
MNIFEWLFYELYVINNQKISLNCRKIKFLKKLTGILWLIRKDCVFAWLIKSYKKL